MNQSFPVEPWGFGPAAAGPVKRSSQPPPQFDADYPGVQSRALLFLRLVLVIPHVIVIYAIGSALALTWIASWFAILATGRLPRALFDLGAYYLRWLAHVAAYMTLLVDACPPFGSGPYPAQFALQYPERSSRLSVFFRLLLAIPAGFVLYLLAVVWEAAVVLAWCAILINRRYPPPLYLFTVGYLRWLLRFMAYVLLLTDHYPPFHLSETANPAATFLAGAAGV